MSRRASARTMCYCVRQQEGARGRASRPKSASPALRCRTTLPMRSSEVPRRQSLRIWWAVRASSWHPPGTSPDCACLALSSDLHGARRCMLMLGHRTERAFSFHFLRPLPRRYILRTTGTSIEHEWRGSLMHCDALRSGLKPRAACHYRQNVGTILPGASVHGAGSCLE